MIEFAVAVAAVAVLALAAVLGAGARTQRARAEAWRRFAEARGLRFLDGGLPVLMGSWEGVPVDLRVSTYASGRGEKLFTRASARFRIELPEGLQLRMGEEGPRAVNQQDGQGVEARALLEDWRIRDALQALARAVPGAAVSGQAVSALRPGVVTDPGELARLLDHLARTVREVEAARIWPEAAAAPEPPPPPLPKASGQAPACVALVGHSLPSRPAVAPPAPPEPTPPVPAPPPRPEPEPAPPPVAAPRAGSEPVGLAELAGLASRDLDPAARRDLARALFGRPLGLVLQLERVAPCAGPDLPAALEGGTGVHGRLVGAADLRLLARLPPALAGAVEGMAWGDRLELGGRFAAWDEFYRQAILDVSTCRRVSG